MSKCIIVGAGDFNETSLPIQEGDFLIAADGGFAYLEQLHIQPHLVVGDFDSLNRIPSHPNVLKLPVEKDDTDMGVAISEGQRRGYTEFFLYGSCGGRMDHTFANIQLLAKLVKEGGKGILFGNHQAIQLLAGPGEIRFSATMTGVFSVLAYSDVCTGLCEEGVYYPLKDYTMSNDTPLGVSNEFVGKEARISLEQGIIMIVTERVCGK